MRSEQKSSNFLYFIIQRYSDKRRNHNALGSNCNRRMGIFSTGFIRASKKRNLKLKQRKDDYVNALISFKKKQGGRRRSVVRRTSGYDGDD